MVRSIDAFRSHFFHDEALGFSVDVSRISFEPGFLDSKAGLFEKALESMSALEAGKIANPDENRQVGHYWLRSPELAPDDATQGVIESTRERVLDFASRIHSGEIRPDRVSRFTHLLVIGIGGSALGPQFVADALGSQNDALTPLFFDNTDPDGFDRVFARLGGRLQETLTVVISKSGGTRETRNGMLEAKAAYERQGLMFAPHAVAVTGEGSELDRFAQKEGFLARFPMWDWVGGRTSETSVVGLLPAALQGIDVRGILGGARAMDELTRRTRIRDNPAALLALGWLSATGGAAKKAMVVLPYKDRLALFSRYLQQLVMESLGKRLDVGGRVVHQGIVVYGNKGSTDQHAYVQQLRDGPDNFFVTFIEVLRSREAARPEIEVEPGVTSGDYLFGFLRGTREALSDIERESMTITLDEVTPATVGALIALYERAVGFYATFVGINAYDQPGVEAGKEAAGKVLALQARLLGIFRTGRSFDVASLASELQNDDEELIFAILRHLEANGRVTREGALFDGRWMLTQGD